MYKLTVYINTHNFVTIYCKLGNIFRFTFPLLFGITHNKLKAGKFLLLSNKYRHMITKTDNVLKSQKLMNKALWVNFAKISRRKKLTNLQ